ncbi:Arc family DNA-binding protein [Edwardsiella tarda]
MSDKQVKDYDKFNVRFPDGMRDAIAKRAKQNGRSMNSEIVKILEESVSKPPQGDEWKLLYFDNPDVSKNDDIKEKNKKIDSLITTLSEEISDRSEKIQDLLKMRRG